MVRGVGRLVWIGTGYDLVVGVLKAITVGAVLRFVAEMVAWGTGAAMLVWATSFFGKPGASEPPELFEYVFSFVFAALGVGAGRGLMAGARFDLTSAEREYAIGLAVTAMIVMSMSFTQGLTEIGRSVSTLVSGQRNAGVAWTAFAFLPVMALFVLGVKWWKAKVASDAGPVVLLATAWWIVAVAFVALGLGLVVHWQIMRQPNPPSWSRTFTFLFQVFPAFIGAASAIPALRRAARESILRRTGCCRSCGYDMTAIEDAMQCPECGRAWTSAATGGAISPTIPAKTP